MRTAVILAGLIASAFPLAAQHQGHATASERPAGAIDTTALKWDAATKTARFKLVSGAMGGKSPFNFNGAVDGELTLVVPLDANVIIDYENEDGVPHSVEIIDASKPIPNMAGNPAIPRAYSRKAIEGMNQGEKDVLRFKAAPAGKYWMFCGVPGHGLSGMYIGLLVDASATEARLVATPRKG